MRKAKASSLRVAITESQFDHDGIEYIFWVYFDDTLNKFCSVCEELNLVIYRKDPYRALNTIKKKSGVCNVFGNGKDV